MNRSVIVLLAALTGLVVGGTMGVAVPLALVLALVALITTPDRSASSPTRPSGDRPSRAPAIRAFLQEARAGRIVDGPTYQKLLDLLDDLEATPAPAAPRHPPPTVWTATQASSTTFLRELEAAPRAPLPAVVAEPGRGRRLWDRLLSDFQLHALAYTGVLLVFVGTLGLVLFAFAGVNSILRPVAEIAIPVVLFGAAGFLRPRGAAFVSSSIELLAGLTTPIVMFASVADDTPFPPDLSGISLVAFATLASLALATLYNVTGRRPGSTLRFLVAPMLWTAVGALGLAFEAGASSSQMAVVAASVAAILGSAAVLRDTDLKRQIEVASIPGAAVVYGLTVLLAATESWPPVPLLVAGTATIGSVLMIRARHGHIPAVSIALAGVTGATLIALAPQWGVARIGVLGVAGFAALLHLETRSVDHPGIGHLLSGSGLAVSVAASLFEPWTGSLATAVLGIALIALPWDERVRVPAAAASFGLSLALALQGLEMSAEGRAVIWGTVSILCALATRLLLRHTAITVVVAVTAVAASLITLVHVVGNAIVGNVLDDSIVHGQLAAAFAVGVTAVVAQHPRVRSSWMNWYAWAMSYPAIVFASVAALGGNRFLHIISMAYGSIAVCGSLGLDDALNSRRSAGQFVRSAWLQAGPVVGVVAIAAGLFGATVHSTHELGLSSVAMAVIVLTGAIQLRVGALSYASCALLSVGLAWLSPWSILDRPWLLVAWGGALTVASFALEKSTRERNLVLRWDLPPLVVAHAAVGLALVLAPEFGTTVPIYVAAGALFLAVAAWRRHPAWIVAGDALIVLGAAYAGLGWLALALASTSVATIVGSEFVRNLRFPLQILAAATATGAWSALDQWLGMSAGMSVAVMAGLSFILTLTYLCLEEINRGRSSRTAATYAAAAAAAASLMALAEWPRRSLLIAALLVTGVEAAAAGFAKLRPAPLHLSALLLLAAWVLHATDALHGQTQWLTVPAGLTILVEVEIARWSNRRVGRTPSSEETVALEYVGMFLLVAPGLFQAVTQSLVYALLVACLGVALMVWGALTQVRRRAMGGAASVLSAATVLVGVPLARILPQMRGAALWVGLAAIGAALIGAATTLERGRVRLAKTAQSLDKLMKGWE